MAKNPTVGMFVGDEEIERRSRRTEIDLEAIRDLLAASQKTNDRFCPITTANLAALLELVENAEQARHETGHELSLQLTSAQDQCESLRAQLQQAQRERDEAWMRATNAVHEILVGNNGSFHLFNTVRDAIDLERKRTP